ncbi:MAG: hypothetical protein JNM07_02820 [Phycisphaerae bacterium]|nr:hypothetical protein [Phycisphaerae bacterium]
MESLRRVLANIRTQVGSMGLSVKLLLASLVVVAIMTLFVVNQYAGRTKTTELLPEASASDLQRAASHLDAVGVPYQWVNGKIHVSAERSLSILGMLGEAGKLPEDAAVTFRNFIEKQNWMNPKSQNDQIYNTALQNTLALALRSFRGVQSATVIIDAPEPAGLGAAVRKPTASVLVVTRGGRPLETPTVDAIASMVASAKAGLDPRNVSISDGTRHYRARAAEDVQASTYLEHVTAVEQRVTAKLHEALAYIPSVIVAVNAQVDVRRTTSTTRRMLPVGQGSLGLVSRETSDSKNQSEAGTAAEAGTRANVEMDLRRGGGGGARTVDERSETEYENIVGSTNETTIDPKGMPTKVNAMVSVPREYVVALVRQSKPPPTAGAADTEPTADEVNQMWATESERLRRDLLPLVETASSDPGSPAPTGTIVVSLIPVPRGAIEVGPAPAGAGAGLMGTLSSLADGSGSSGPLGGLIKPVVLGGLAVAALGMMLVLVRSGTKSPPLPTAQELGGVPPALEGAEEIVGEAEEGETAMTGIELDEGALSAKNVLEQVSKMIKENPRDAAQLVNRWIAN